MRIYKYCGTVFARVMYQTIIRFNYRCYFLVILKP